MFRSSRIFLCSTLIASLALASFAHAGPTNAQKCEAKKVQEATKYKYCRGKAIAKGIKKNEAPDFSKCDMNYSKHWQNAETKYGAECPTLGDEATIQAQCISCVDDLVAALEVKRVFLSSTTQDGAMGGIAGADAICNNLAANAGLSGTYKAWLSDGAGSPSTTFTHSASPYVRVDGVVVANDWADLTDGSIAAPIEVDESGTNLYNGGQFFVFTSTSGDGTSFGGGLDCNSWADGTAGSVGIVGYGNVLVGEGWSVADFDVCSSPRHIYCFEQ